MRRYALTDIQWNCIKNILLWGSGYVGLTAQDNRLFVEAVLYRYRACIPWRDLPERFGDFRVIHLRYTRWSGEGILEEVFDTLSKDVD